MWLYWAYPYPKRADIDAALRYAASLAEDETIELVARLSTSPRDAQSG